MPEEGKGKQFSDAPAKDSPAGPGSGRSPGAMLGLFIQQAPAALAMFDQEMRYLSVSQRWLEDYGLLGRDILGLSHYEIFPEIGEAWKAVHRRALQGEVIKAEEDGFPRADGTLQWLRWEVRPWLGSDGRIGGIVIFSEDITRYKVAEATQRHLSSVLRAIRNINQLITRARDRASLLREACALLTDSRGYLSAWVGLRQAGSRIGLVASAGLGLHAEALAAQLEKGACPQCCRELAEGRDLVLHRDTKAECEGCVLADRVQGYGALAGALRHGDRDYGLLVVSLPSTLAADPEEQSLFQEVLGDLSYALHALEEETVSARTAEALRDSEVRFRATFEQAAVGLAELSLDGVWLRVNERLCSILGHGEAGLLGAPIAAILGPGDLAQDQASMASLREGRIRTCTSENLPLRADGSPVPVNLTLSLMRDGGGEARYFIAVVEDLRERKKAEAELHQALEEKESLLRELYHRTRNNMLTVIGMMSLRASSHPGTSLLDFVEDISDRIHSMALVHEKLYQFRNLSRIDLGDFLADLARLELGKASVGGRVGLELSLEEVPVLIDTAMPMAIVVGELLTNALRHAFPKGREGKICLGLSRSDSGQIRLSIHDDGIGLPGEGDAGSSYGLSMIYAIVEQQLQGRIDRLPGQGTSYVITFKDNLYKERV